MPGTVTKLCLMCRHESPNAKRVCKCGYEFRPKAPKKEMKIRLINGSTLLWKRK